MKNTSINDLIKKTKINKKVVNNKASSWLGNVGKSFGYSAMSVLKDIAPGSFDVVSSISDSAQSAISMMREMKSSRNRIGDALDKNVYMNIGKETLLNAIDDLRTGKLNNVERKDNLYNIDDIDVGSDDDYFQNTSFSSDDGLTQVSTSSGENTNIVNVDTDVGRAGTPLIDAINQSSIDGLQGTAALINTLKGNQSINMQINQIFRQSLLGNIATISENLSSVSSIVPPMMSKHFALSAKFYDSNISRMDDLISTIQNSIRMRAESNAYTAPEEIKKNSNVLDIFSSSGFLNFGDYANLVKKQANDYVSSNFLLSQIKNMTSDTDTLKYLAQSPLEGISKAFVKGFIPNILKESIKGFDEMLQETMITGLHRVKGLSRSENPLLQAIGKVFGVENNLKTSIDRSNYQKGAIEWNGVANRTLVEVIPYYLRKITSALTNEPEKAFDISSGVFRNVHEIVTETQKSNERRMLGNLNGVSGDFKDFINRNFQFTNSKQYENLSNTFDKFLRGLVTSEGGRTFRVTENGDDIASLTGLSTSDPIVQMIRGFFEGSSHGYTSRVFGRDVLDAQASYTKYMKDAEVNPFENNMIYLNNGDNTLDKQFKYNSNGRFVGVDHNKTLGLRDASNKSAVDYSRRILKLLSSGIKVFVTNMDEINKPSTDSGSSIHRNNLSNEILLKSDNEKRYMGYLSQVAAEREAAEMRDAQGTDYSNEDATSRAHGRIVANLRSYDDNMQISAEQIRMLRQVQRVEDDNRENNETSWITRLSNAGVNTPMEHILNKFTSYLRKPSEVLTDVFKKADDFLFKLVFGDDNINNGGGSLIKRAFDNMKIQFSRFSTWMNTKIFTPLNEALFGDNGFITRLKQSSMGQEFKKMWENSKNFMFGAKDENGNRRNGFFSDVYNEIKDAGKYVGQYITGREYVDSNGVTHPAISNSVWENIRSVTASGVNKIKSMFGADDESNNPSVRLTLVERMNNLWDSIKLRGSMLMDTMFGAEDPSNTKRNAISQFSKEMKDKSPKVAAYGVIGAGTGIALGSMSLGFIPSLFLPGGPIGGALMGLGIGIVTQSNQIKDWLFGKVEDGERIGGLITKETQDFFKDNAKGITIGGFTGLAASMGFIPSLFVPGGPIGGALIGGAVSMALKNEKLQELLYGTYDENGNKMTDGILGNIKSSISSKWDKGRFLDVGIGAGVGVLGSFFLPGGPILGAALGAATAIGLTTEKFKVMMFGDKDPTTNKRIGGLFPKINDWLGDNVFSPLKKSILKTQVKVMGFIETNMVNPLMTAMLPIKSEFLKIKDRISTGIKNAFIGFKDTLNNTFEKHFGEPIGEFLKIHVLNPFKSFFSKLFGGIGRLIGGIISSPIKIVGAVADGIFERDKKAGSKDFFNNTVLDAFGFNREKSKQRKENNERLKFTDRLKMIGSYLNLNNRKEAKYSDAGAYYGHEYEYMKNNLNLNSKLKMDEKLAAIENGTYDEYKRQEREKKKNKNRRQAGTITQQHQSTNNNPVESAESNITNQPSQPQINSTISNPTDMVETYVNSTIRTTQSEQEQTTVSPISAIQNSNIENPVNVVESHIASNIHNQNSIVDNANNSILPPINNNPVENVESAIISNITNQPQGSSSNDNSTTDNNTSSSRSIINRSRTLEQSREGIKIRNRDFLLSKIEKNVAIIADSTDHQLNGVGSNVQKIFKILKKTNNISDEDVSGENNKSFVGFFGRMLDKLKHPLESIENIIFTPVRIAKNLVGLAVDKVVDVVSGITKIPGIIYTGVKNVASGVANILGKLLEIPVNITKIGLTFAKSFFPVVAEGMIGVIRGIGMGISAAGSLLVQSIKTVGGFAYEAAKGFGSLISGALSNLGSLLYSVGLISKDAIVAIGKGIVKSGAFIGKTVLNIVSGGINGLVGAGSSILGSMFSGFSAKSKTRYKPLPTDLFNVYIKGGYIDGIKNRQPSQSISSSSTLVPTITSSNIVDSRISAINNNPVESVTRSMPDDSNVDTNVQQTEEVSTGHTRNISSITNSLVTNMSTAFGKIKERMDEKSRKKEEAKEARERVTRLDYNYQREEIEKEEKEKSKNSYFVRLMANVRGINTGIQEHVANWSSIFSKKGLLTGALILGIAALPKIVDWIKNFDLKNLIPNISLPDVVVNIGDAIGNISGSIIETLKDWLFPSKENQGEDEGRIDEDGNLVVNEGKQHAALNFISKGVAGVVDGVSGFTAGKGGIISKAVSKLTGKTASVAKTFYEAGDTYLGKTLTKRAAAKVNKQLQSEAVETALRTGISSGKNFVGKLGSALTGSDSVNKNMIQKFFSLLSDSVEYVLNSSVAKKFVNSKVVVKILATLKPMFTAMQNFVVKTSSKWLTKIGMAVAEDGSLIFPPLGVIVKVLFGAYDLLTGMSKVETARMFQISEGDVTGGMRVAGGLSKMIVGLSAIVDIASEIFRVWTDGTGFKEILAQLIYKGAVEAGGFIGMDSEQSFAKLESAQSEFKSDFELYNQRMEDEGKEQMSFAGYTDMVNKHWSTRANEAIGKALGLRDDDGNTLTLTGKLGDGIKHYFNDSTVLGAFNEDNVRDKLKISEDDEVTLGDKFSVGLANLIDSGSFGLVDSNKTSKYISEVGSWISDKGKDIYGWTKEKIDSLSNMAKNFGEDFSNNKSIFAAFDDNKVRSKLGLEEGVDLNLQDRFSVGLANFVEAITFGNLKSDDSILSIYGTIESVKQKANEIWKSVLGSVENAKTSIKDNIGKAVSFLDDSIGNIFNLTGEDGGHLSLSKWANAIPTQLSVTMDNIKNEAFDLYDSVKSKLSSWKDSAKGWVSSSLTNLDKSFGNQFGLTDDKGNPLPLSEFSKARKFDELRGWISKIGDMFSNAYNSLKDSIKNAFDKILKAIPNAIEGLDRAIGGMFGLKDGDLDMRISDAAKKGISAITDSIKTNVGNIKDNVGNFLKSLFSENESKAREIISNRNSNASSQGINAGYGEPKQVFGQGDTENGFVYYSQNDPKYKDVEYSVSGNGSSNISQTIGSRGCGPTAMAMVATQLTGKRYDPAYMSNMAQRKGYSTQFGTSSNYFNDASRTVGLKSAEMMPSKSSLVSSLKSGNPMILQGASKSGSTPFTKAGHYVVATGTDGNKVTVNDPRGKKYSKKYNINDVLKSSNRMWAFGNGGYGEEDEQNKVESPWEKFKGIFSSKTEEMNQWGDKLNQFSKEDNNKWWSGKKIDKEKVTNAVDKYAYQLIVQNNPRPPLPTNLTNEEMNAFYRILNKSLDEYRKNEDKAKKKDEKEAKKTEKLKDTGKFEENEAFKLDTNSSGQLSLADNKITVGQIMPEIAKRYEGYQYLWGKAGPIDWAGKAQQGNGFDCSGLTSFATYMSGVTNYGRYTANSMARRIGETRLTNNSASDLQPGDLLFIDESGNSASHIGIYSGDNRWVESGGKKGVNHPGVVVKEAKNMANTSTGWTHYGRLPEADNIANVTNTEVLAKLGDNFSVPVVTKHTTTGTDQSEYIDSSQASSDNTSSGFSSISDFFSTITNKIGSAISQFLFGKSSKNLSVDENLNIVSESNPSSPNSAMLSESSDYINSLGLSDEKKKIISKTAELTAMNEADNNFTLVANDQTNNRVRISPSIGVGQWRESTAKRLIDTLYAKFPDDDDLRYFANDVDWSDRTPWSEDKMSRLRNALQRHEDVNKDVQMKYLTETVKDNVEHVYKEGVETQKIHDPRSVVFLSDIANTGKYHMGEYFSSYKPTDAEGMAEVDNVYKHIKSYKGVWSSDLYDSRYAKSINSLSKWTDAPETVGGFGEVEGNGQIEYNNEFRKNIYNDKPNENYGFGDVVNKIENDKLVRNNDFSLKYLSESERINNDKMRQTINYVNNGAFDDTKIDKLISVVSEILDVNISMNKTMKDIGSKDFSLLDGKTSQVFGSGNVTNNSITIESKNDSHKKSSTNNKSIPKLSNGERINRSIDMGEPYEIAKRIASGYLF